MVIEQGPCPRLNWRDCEEEAAIFIVAREVLVAGVDGETDQ
jgi:hypothetical protein